MDVEVKINRRVFDYDQIIIIGPVFPHEVVGFSGGNKYLFPGVGGPEVLNFFHWLGAVVTNPMIIGNKWTPVRKVVDRAGVDGARGQALFLPGGAAARNWPGSSRARPKAAWDEASELSRQLHIIYKEQAVSHRSSPARRRCTTSSGSAANACTNSSRCWPMAAN